MDNPVSTGGSVDSTNNIQSTSNIGTPESPSRQENFLSPLFRHKKVSNTRIFTLLFYHGNCAAL